MVPKNHTWKLMIGVGITIVIALTFFVRRPQATSIGTEANTEHKDDYTVTTSCRGQSLPIGEHYLTVKNGGTLDDVLVSENSLVHKGQILGLIEKTKTKADLQSALSRYTLAAKEYQRNQSLYRSQSATAQELDEARSKWISAKSDLESARQQLEDGVLRAPVDGYLSVSLFRKGDYVPSGSRVMVVEDRTQYSIICKIPAQYTQSLPQRAEVTITPVREDGSMITDNTTILDAAIALVNPDSNFEGLNSDIRLLFGELPKNFKLKASLFIEIPIKTYADVVLVDTSALIRRGDYPYFLVKKSDGNLAWHKISVIDQLQDKVVVSNFSEADNILIPKIALNELEKKVKASL